MARSQGQARPQATHSLTHLEAVLAGEVEVEGVAVRDPCIHDRAARHIAQHLTAAARALAAAKVLAALAAALAWLGPGQGLGLGLGLGPGLGPGSRVRAAALAALAALAVGAAGGEGAAVFLCGGEARVGLLLRHLVRARGRVRGRRVD